MNNSQRVQHNRSSRKNSQIKNKNAQAIALKRKKKRRNNFIMAIVLILLVLIIACISVFSIINGMIKGDQNLATEIATQTEFQDKVVNILLCGLDYDNENADGYVSEENKVGRTDLILYIHYNVENNEASILQIPRDTYVGESDKTGGTGKINALYYCESDNKNRVNALAQTINQQLKLPVDYYVTLDMDALKEMMTALNKPLYVYVPVDMDYNGSYIGQGWRYLDGDSLEFFLRNRKSESYQNQGDIKRLEVQRYFYSALYHEFTSLSTTEFVKLIPVFTDRVTTNMPLDKLTWLAKKAIELDGSNILFARLPGGPATYNGSAVFGLEEEQTAELLNEYYRMPEQEVGLSDLDIQTLKLSKGVYEAEPKTMTEVQSSEESDTQEAVQEETSAASKSAKK